MLPAAFDPAGSSVLRQVYQQLPAPLQEPLMGLVIHIGSKLYAAQPHGILGLHVASSFERNLWIASLTAAAVWHQREQGHRDVTVFELGLGSGLNAIAACLAGASRVVGWETEPACIRFAAEKIRHFGFADRVEIRDGSFLEEKFAGLSADVVVNENISSGLAYEPFFDAAQAVLPALAAHSVIVPAAVEVFCRAANFEAGREVALGRVDLSASRALPLVLSTAGHLEIGAASVQHFALSFILRDFRGRMVLSPRDRITGLELSARTGALEIESGLSGARRVTFRWPPAAEMKSRQPVGFVLAPIEEESIDLKASEMPRRDLYPPP